MKPSTIKCIYKFLNETGPESKNDTVLFRGQPGLDPLLPRIARQNPKKDTKLLERKMLNELRRIGGANFPHKNENDLDLLVRAQHFGMATRLLDWTSNPLVAIWFACTYSPKNKPGHIYFFEPSKKDIPFTDDIEDPFSKRKTLIFKPNLNNPRIIAQSGWFTLHSYSSKAGNFVPLEKNTDLKKEISCYEIPANEKSYFLEDLNHMGINARSLFPDATGICLHLNWLHNID